MLYGIHLVMASMQNMPWTSHVALVSLCMASGRFCGLAPKKDPEGYLRVRSSIRPQQAHQVDGQRLCSRLLAGWRSSNV
jgi:hypothetical protein